MSQTADSLHSNLREPAPLPHADDAALPQARLMWLTQALQTTLNIPQLLELFVEGASPLVPLDGVEFTAADGEQVFRTGDRARHTCSYTLRLEQETLGRLCFRRRRRFSEDEAHLLENMMCALLYPLRNACLYRAAVAQASRDPLTGIGNRAALNDALAHEISISRRHRTALSMVVFDIDHFKRINDTHGHARGDCAIREVVAAARSCARGCDCLFRYGGEEFVLLLRNTDAAGAAVVAERVRRKVERLKCDCDGETLRLTVSAGVAELNPAEEADKLFERADQALLSAKQAGRNRVEVAQD
ncbi:GGDEF domain-containing protein [Thiohalobacter sp.]|uniref:GGDEF domain-containing protein n=1 Tax=Thiohalobacter sp. TaxID=2025948 RepID=UPI00262E3180|nr:GGDEF domain-containing protein [Thiohalobacter sp.]